jgi:hypothetical protein
MQNFTLKPGASLSLSLESEDIVFLRGERACSVPFSFIQTPTTNNSLDLCKLGELLFRGQSLEIKLMNLFDYGCFPRIYGLYPNRSIFNRGRMELRRSDSIHSQIQGIGNSVSIAVSGR